jgi:hypothetical protein
VPEGWKLPVAEDFEKLYDAALTLTGGLDVLKCPIAYGSAYFGKWGFNAYENGCLDGAGYVAGSSHGGMYYAIQATDAASYRLDGWGVWAPAPWRCGTIRFKYID